MACACGMSGCNAEGLGGPEGGVSDRSPVRKQYLLGRLDAAQQVAKGQLVQVPLDTLQPTNELGYHCHIAALRIRGTAQFDVVAASLPAAIAGYELLSLYDNVFVENNLDNHQHVAGLDGRSIRDDYVVRNKRALIPDPAQIPDADATNLQIPVELYIPFTRHDEHGPTRRGLVPLVAFTGKGRQAIRFTSASLLAGGAVAGLTIDGFQGQVFVWADVVYLPTLSYEAWQIEHYTIQETEGRLRHCDRWHEHASLRYFAQDTGGQDLSDLTGLTVQANGQVIVNGINSASNPASQSGGSEIIQQNRMWIDADPDADSSLFQTANGLSATFGILTDQMRRAVPSSPRGALTYKVSGRTTHQVMRFLHRTIRDVTMGALQELVACSKVNAPAAHAALAGGRAMVAKAPGASVRVYDGARFPSGGSAKAAEEMLF